MSLNEDGGPVHPYDEDFRFGREKAKLIVAAMELIDEFASNSIVESREVQSKRFGLRFRAWVEMHDEFVHSSGVAIHRPWLKLEVLPAGTGAEIGVGVQKAKALVALRNELEVWIT